MKKIENINFPLRGLLRNARKLACKDNTIKFNDYFEFPRELDMEPYTVQGLAKADGKIIFVHFSVT